MKAVFRPISTSDNPVIANIIRTVMPEFGADLPGFAIFDPEVDRMQETYSRPGSAYFICEVDGAVVGGAGIAPLKGGDGNVCELQKMYFLKEGRGKGLGRDILKLCLKTAQTYGYHQCYIETFHPMKSAIALYESCGFVPIDGPLGDTGHFACDAFYLLDLSPHREA